MPGREDHFVTDPLTGELSEIRKIQPYQAQKDYRCPGCNQEIMPGTSHYVIVPIRVPLERRHWHLACWERRTRMRPGRA